MNHQKIKKLREEKDWTMQQAADAAGFKSRQHWNNIENAHQTVSAEQLQDVAHALGVKVDDLLTPRRKSKP